MNPPLVEPRPYFRISTGTWKVVKSDYGPVLSTLYLNDRLIMGSQSGTKN